MPRPDAERPLIVVTNDDGIESPGLRAAAEASVAIGEVLVVAPIAPQTAMGRSFPRTATQGSIEVRQRPLGGDRLHPYYAVDGSPAQAVAHAVLEIAPRRPALCISGVNDGENLGGTIMISGTVGAAAEAAALGIPAMAVSLGPAAAAQFTRPYATADWAVARQLIGRIASRMVNTPLPPEVALLNVNIPPAATIDTEIRVTAQSRQYHYPCGRPGPRDLSQPFRLPVIEEINFATLEPHSDIYAVLVDRVISVTPLGHDLTVRNTAGYPVDVGIPKSCRLAADVLANADVHHEDSADCDQRR
jgi:5'-nucleotidase